MYGDRHTDRDKDCRSVLAKLQLAWLLALCDDRVNSRQAAQASRFNARIFPKFGLRLLRLKLFVRIRMVVQKKILVADDLARERQWVIDSLLELQSSLELVFEFKEAATGLEAKEQAIEFLS